MDPPPVNERSRRSALNEDEDEDYQHDDDYGEDDEDDEDDDDDDAGEDDEGNENASAGNRGDVDDELPDDGTCRDRHANCAFWAKVKECKKNPSYMLKYCRESCGACGAEKEGQFSANVENDYDTDENDEGSEFEVPTEACENLDEECNFWAENGECELNPGYMETHCALACGTCDATAQDDDEDDQPMDDEQGQVKIVPITTPEGKIVKIKCKDRHNSESCKKRAAAGECSSSSPGKA